MYCPKCATQNADDSRFCRVCGAPLEIVALALDGKLVRKKKPGKTKSLQPEEESPELSRAKGTRDVVTGSILIAASLLILLGPMPFIQQAFPWLVIWATMFGWMAIWGTISLANGLGEVFGSRGMIQPQHPSIEIQPAPTTSELLVESHDNDALFDVSAPPSVTETTTRTLNARSE